MAKDERTRNWTFVLYPESAPEDWRSRIDDLHIQWVESPIHDKDINPNGEPKKPHWHILLLFDGKKSYEQICMITQMVNGTIPQKCANVKGLVRYMIHLDNPEKYQYEFSDIVCHGGYDLAEIFRPSATQRYEIIRDMGNYVRENHITEFSDLYFYAQDYKFDSWFPLLCDNSAYILKALIASLRHYPDQSNSQVKVDPETGEIKE